MGKTQTAAQYAHRHRNDYPFVLWVRAESADTLFADLTQLAARLELPEREAKEQSVVVAAVEGWVDGQERWLMVLDNVEDYGVVRDLARKANENGRHVIITTQRQALGAIGKQGLTPMNEDLGALLLLRRAGRVAPLEKAPSAGVQPTAGPSTAFTRPGEPGRAHSARDDSSSFPAVDAKEAALAREISEEVGGLPLALDQRGRLYRRDGLQPGRLPDAAAATIRGVWPSDAAGWMRTTWSWPPPS